jgi:transketolase
MMQKADKMESLREAYGNELAVIGEKKKDIVVLDADLSSSTKTGVFAKKFPDRFFNMGISEQSMVTAAAGLSLAGKTVFASTFAVFLSNTYNAIRQSVCYNEVPVNFVVTHSGISLGEDGPTHQIVEDVGIMSGLPNMKVIVPVDSVETVSVVDYLSEKKTSPYYVRLTREKFPVLNDENYEFKEGKSVTFREGSDVTIMAYGIMVSFALKAAEQLRGKGIDTRVVNMSSIKPLDRPAIIKAARETGKIITAEEHSIFNGLGSRVAEVTADEYPVPILRIGMPDIFGKSGRGMELFDYFHIGVNDIVEKTDKFFKRDYK